ncbi:MAG TPA: ABC transporter permease [Vicinamibacterales bacterium]|jgi:predicted permease
MENFAFDLRYALRSFLRQPAFALTAILTLALGIAATTAMFSVVNAVVFRPLPFPDADRIVAVLTLWTRTGVRSPTVSGPDFTDWKAQSRSFAAIAYYQGGETSVTIGPTADYVGVFRVTRGFFDALGAKAQAGRLLSDEEWTPNGPLSVVITDGFWRRQFNRDRGAIGSTVKFGDRVYTIVGVLQPGERYPATAEIYCVAAPLAATASRGGHNYRVIARLNEGVSVEQANAEMVGIAKRLEQEYPSTNAAKSAAVLPLLDVMLGDTRQTLLVLLAAVGLVLLIACANVANLLLARSTVREREMVLRAAVGAGRSRLVRQLLTESAVLAVVSALCGVWLARLGVLALVALAPADLPRLDDVRVDGVVLMFALAVALAASVICGLAPALHASRVQLVEGLRQSGKGSSIGGRGAWARSAFVVAEIALAVVLVFGAALLGRSLLKLAAVDMGFLPEQLLVLRTVVPVKGIDDAPRATAFYRDLLTDVRAVPGVTAIGAVTSLPTAVRSNGAYSIEGRPSISALGVGSPQALFTVITPDYFRALRVPFKSGRDFNDGDRRGAQYVAIINESLARASFPGDDPLGRRIQCGLDTPEYMTIVGVVADIRTAGPSRPVQPEIYMPFEQHPGPATALNLVARTQTADPLALADTIGRKIRERNPDVPVKTSTMEGTLDVASATPRFRTLLLGVFAVVALLLALAGVYGVMAYTVNQRLPELGVRVALGASPKNIMRLVVGHGARLAAAGLAIGLALSVAAGRLLQGLLFNVAPRDPLLLAIVCVGVAAATVAACFLPGRRAVRVDPMIALRAE